MYIRECSAPTQPFHFCNSNRTCNNSWPTPETLLAQLTVVQETHISPLLQVKMIHVQKWRENAVINHGKFFLLFYVCHWCTFLNARAGISALCVQVWIISLTTYVVWYVCSEITMHICTTNCLRENTWVYFIMLLTILATEIIFLIA